MSYKIKPGAIQMGKAKCAICNTDIENYLIYFNRWIENDKQYFYEILGPIQFPTCKRCSELIDEKEIVFFNHMTNEILSELINKMRARLVLPPKIELKK